MNSDIYEKLDELSKKFFIKFVSIFSDIDYTYDYDNQLIIKIPEKNRDFGSMVIHCDKDEIVICLGSHFHTHFDTYSFSSKASSIIMDQVTLEAIGFTRDVLDDKVVLEVEMTGNQLISSNIYHIDKNIKENTKIITSGGIILRIFNKNRSIFKNTWTKAYED